MAAGPLSRYQGMDVVQVRHQTRGATRSLPVRRLQPVPATADRLHRYTGYDTTDLLALRFFGREDLYWFLLDANGGRLPDDYRPGELIVVPPAEDVTRIQRA